MKFEKALEIIMEVAKHHLLDPQAIEDGYAEDYHEEQEAWEVLEKACKSDKSYLFTNPEYRQMVVCMDCGRFIKYQPCNSEMAEFISHGLCDDCYENREREMDKMKEEVEDGS